MDNLTQFKTYSEGRKRHKKARRIKNIVKRATDIGVGAGLLGAGVLGLKSLGKRGFFPNVFKEDVQKNIAKKTREGLEYTIAAVIPGSALAGTTIGADYLIDRKNDLPITRSIRNIKKSSFSNNVLLLSDFKRQTRDDKGKKRGKYRKRKGLLDRSKYLNYVTKSALIGAGTKGTLAGISASPVPPLILPATAIGAVEGGVSGAVTGSAIYGAKKGIQEYKRSQKRKRK